MKTETDPSTLDPAAGAGAPLELDHDTIEEQLVVERYLLGKLSDAELEGFEEHYLYCGECLERLQLAETLQRGLKGLAAEQALEVATASQLGFAAWLGRFVHSRYGASVLLGLLLIALLPGGLALQRVRELGRELDAVRGPQINTAVLALSTERGAGGTGPTHQYRLAKEPGWLNLTLELDAPQFDTYRVRLLEAGGGEIWSGDGFQPNYLDALSLSLHSSQLAPGDLRIEVDGISADGESPEVARFSLRVLPAE